MGKDCAVNKRSARWQTSNVFRCLLVLISAGVRLLYLVNGDQQTALFSLQMPCSLQTTCLSWHDACTSLSCSFNASSVLVWPSLPCSCRTYYYPVGYTQRLHIGKASGLPSYLFCYLLVLMLCNLLCTCTPRRPESCFGVLSNAGTCRNLHQCCRLHDVGLFTALGCG